MRLDTDLARRVAIRTGLPYGLLTAAALTPPGRYTIPDFIATAVIAGICAGGIQGLLVGATYHRLRTTGMDLLFVAMLFASAAGASLALLATLHIPHGRWTRLPSPPERLVGLGGPDCTESVGQAVYGSSRTGSYFRYLTYPRGDWIRVDDIPAPVARSWPCPNKREGHVPRRPRQVVDDFHTETLGPDYYYHAHFALRENGEVWLWQERSNALSLPAGIIAAYLLSLCLGVAAWVRLLRKRRREMSGVP